MESITATKEIQNAVAADSLCVAEDPGIGINMGFGVRSPLR